MKKIMILILCVSALSGLFADRMMMVQGSYVGSTKSFEDNSGESDFVASNVGLNISTFNGETLGFFGAFNFASPTKLEVVHESGTNEIELDNYTMSITMDYLMGVGYLLDLESVQFIFAGGLHFNGFAMISDDINYDSFLSYGIGPGLNVTFMFPLSDSFHLNISGQGGLDMVEIVRVTDNAALEDADYTGGSAFSVSAGLGFKY